MAQSNTSGTSSRRQGRSSLEHHETLALAPGGRFDTEWEAREAARQRELEEARARAAQMEKTMRWWSDCTANWREKWSKVRNERNKAREESKMLRSKLEAALKDTGSYKRDKLELEAVNCKLREEMERMQQLILRDWEGGGSSECGKGTELLYVLRGDSSEQDSQQECEEYILQGAVPKHAIERYAGSVPPQPKENAVDAGEDEEEGEGDAEVLHQKMAMLQLRLEESQKIVHAEREERGQLRRSLDRAQAELAEARGRAEELRAARQEAARELLSLQAAQAQEAQAAQLDRRDEQAQRDSLDRRLAGLRAEVTSAEQGELERLQAENAVEWGKRERLETEKLTMERENKKLRAEVRDLQERLEQRRGARAVQPDQELRQLQQEAQDRGKELLDLKHAHGKLKKVLQDKSTELGHAVRRAEQYEAEVKRLRARVEELKRELATAEDEVDSATNNIRKLQRSNDELQEQVESLQVQLRHLEARLRSSNGGLLSHRTGSSSGSGQVRADEPSDDDY